MEYFIYESELRLLCCRTCQTMVTRKQVKLHLRNAPHNLNSQEIKLAQEWASKCDIFEAQVEAHVNLPPRPDDAPPIVALGPPGTGGIRCEFIPEQSTLSQSDCPYVGAELRRIREHLRVKHNWDMELKGGRRSAAVTDKERSNSPWRTGVYYQRLFSSGPGSELFEVARGLNLEQSRVQDHESQVRLQQAIDAFQSKGKDIRSREAERIDAENDVTAPNPWLRRLGSALHLKDFSGKKDFLRDLIAMEYETDPDDPVRSDDAQLRFVHIAFDRLINHAKAVITPNVISWNALFEVNRKELVKERTKPFHFRFKPETQRRYALVVKQLLAYIVRCMSFKDKADRPPFKLSIRQQSAYDVMMEHADDLTEAWKEHGGDPEAPEIARLLDLLETAVLELYISVLDHFTKDTEYDSVLVSFLTVLSVRADGAWEGYGGFTPKLSAIMAISRLCITKYAVDQRTKAIKQKTQQGQSQEEAKENSPSHFSLISEMTRRFMVGGGEGWETTPTQFIIRLRNFGMAAQNNTASHGSVSWDNSREQLIYKGTRLGVLDVQAMMRLAVQQLETVLYKDLLLFTEFFEQSPAELGLPEIPWDELLDNAADETVGHSFIDKLFQHDGGASRGWVIKKILQNNGLRAKWVTSMNDGGMELNSRLAYRYGLKVEKALELLAVLAHMSSGFPLRAWELLVVRHRNTSNGGIRNILCDRGLIMIVTGAHKGFTTTGRLKIIHRFLPREVGTLLTYYLWLVLPFWEDIQANIWNKSSFDAGLWATEGTQESEKSQDSEQADGAIDPGQNQTSQVGEGTQENGWSLGPGEHWTSPRLSRNIRRLSALACGQKLNISSWRHISTAIGRRYFRNASTAHTRLLHEVDSDDSGSESDDDEDSPYDLQAGHGSKTAGLIYGRLITEGAFETNERRVNFRYISEEWHRLLGFPSAMGGFGEVLTPGRKRKKASVCDEALRKLQLERWKTRRRINIDRELIHLYGDQAAFRGVQREAIQAIMMNKSPIVVVMGTGGGKSLSFMLPAASCPSGVTVVVVPLVSLQGDLIERCRKMKIPCTEWRSDQSPGPASLVFVTPESAMTKRFHDYVEGLRVMAQLDGFVFDEAHTILEGTRDFRPKLRELGRLALVGVQMVYLTATLPPSKEAEFFELINARPEDVTMIRTSTTRANVMYSVQTLTAATAEQATEAVTTKIREVLDQKLGEYPWPAKIIVYCNTVVATDALATELNCDAYHRDVDTRDGKAERLRAWMSGVERERYGGGRVIVATNALGLGIDIPDIRVVMHVEMPFEMADYAQQSGRAGRDGKRSEAIVLRVVAEGQRRMLMGLGGRGAVDDFVNGQVCRRVILDSEMDGRGNRDRCEEGEEPCDVCQAADAMVEAEDSELSEEDEEIGLRAQEIGVQQIRSRVASRAIREAREVELFRERLQERLLGGCMFCYPLGMADANPDHTGIECSMARTGSDLPRKIFDMGLRMQACLRREGELEKFGGCFRCFLPQELCNGWEENTVELLTLVTFLALLKSCKRFRLPQLPA